MKKTFFTGIALVAFMITLTASAFWPWGDNDEKELQPLDFYNQSVENETVAFQGYTESIRQRLVAERNLAITKKNASEDGPEIARLGVRMGELKDQIQGIESGTFGPVCTNQVLQEHLDEKESEIQRLRDENERLKLGL